MKCLLKYQRVKLPRALMPVGKGIIGYWAKLASRAAFRNGQAKYRGYINDVTVGTWSGGVLGLKSILVTDIFIEKVVVQFLKNPEALDMLRSLLAVKTT